MRLSKKQVKQLRAFLSSCHPDQFDEVHQIMVQHLRPRQTGSLTCRPTDDKYERVEMPFYAIAYVESRKHVLMVHRVGEKEGSPLLRVLGGGLKEHEELLAKHDFVKPHKSFMVSMPCIRRFKANREIELRDSTTLKGGEKYNSPARHIYEGWLKEKYNQNGHGLPPG